MNAFCVEVADKRSPIKEENECKAKATLGIDVFQSGSSGPSAGLETCQFR